MRYTPEQLEMRDVEMMKQIERLFGIVENLNKIDTDRGVMIDRL